MTSSIVQGSWLPPQCEDNDFLHGKKPTTPSTARSQQRCSQEEPNSVLQNMTMMEIPATEIGQITPKKLHHNHNNNNSGCRRTAFFTPLQQLWVKTHHQKNMTPGVTAFEFLSATQQHTADQKWNRWHVANEHSWMWFLWKKNGLVVIRISNCGWLIHVRMWSSHVTTSTMKWDIYFPYNRCPIHFSVIMVSFKFFPKTDNSIS